MKFYEYKKWHFRDNNSRKKGSKNKGRHPSLIIGKTKDNKKYINLGLTHSTHRGYHKNIEIQDPIDWKNISYIRDDIKTDDISKLKNILKEYKLHPKDVDKILNIIYKYKKKNSH